MGRRHLAAVLPLLFSIAALARRPSSDDVNKADDPLISAITANFKIRAHHNSPVSIIDRMPSYARCTAAQPAYQSAISF